MTHWTSRSRLLSLLLVPLLVATVVTVPRATAASVPDTPQAYLKSSNSEASDNFGFVMALSGDTLVVGANGEDSNATGVNGNGTDNSASGAGAAYVFVRNGGVWSQQAYLKPSNTDTGDSFGSSVAISGDTIVVGAPVEDSNATGVGGNQADNSASGAGAAYVFTRSGGSWAQEAYLKASNTAANDQFGYSVAISGDTIAVSSRLEDSNAVGVNGNGSDNSASGAGAAYVFTRSAGSWTQQAYVKASNSGANDQFGFSLAIAGDTLVVGAITEASNATGVNGNQADDTAFGAGAAYVLTRTAGVWSQQAYLKASNTEANDQFGDAVSLSGNTVVVSANFEDSAATGVNGNQADNTASAAGAAYVFTSTGGVWTQQAYLKASNPTNVDAFGGSLALDGDSLAVGASLEDSNATGFNGDQSDNSASSSGAVYSFTRSGTTWSQREYLKSPNSETGDNFGISVAQSSGTLAVGAYFEDSDATGVNGSQANNSALSSGAAYTYVATAPSVTSSTRTTASPTGLGTVSYDVAFSEPVTGVDGTDFTVASTGVTGAAVTGVTGSGSAYTVTVSTGSGSGTIRLDVGDDDTIVDGFTNPLGGSGTGNGAFTAGQSYAVSKSVTVTSRSVGAQDGSVLESRRTSSKGRSVSRSAATFTVGDDKARRQSRGILSFSTGASLPDNAVITGVTLTVKRAATVGKGNPVTALKGFLVDAKLGTFGSAALQPADFQAKGSRTVGPVKAAPVGNVYSFDLTSAKASVNRLATHGGLTQIRLRFVLGDNKNKVANYLRLFSGNASTANRPRLLITYTS